jgi:molybdenum cofactor biosynthesis enzyme MoaA
LTQEQIFEIVRANSKFKSVELGGGEPFLHPNIFGILSQLQSIGKKAHVATNAVALPEGLFSLENKVKQNTQMQVSLHASNTQLYKKITGHDYFDQVIKNVTALNKEFQTTFSSAIYHENLEDVPNLVSLANNLQVPIRFNLVFPIGRGKTVGLLSPREVDQLRGYLLVQKILRSNLIDSPLTRVNNCGAVQSAYGIKKCGICPADNGDKLYISPSGKRYSCEMLHTGGTD